MTFRYNRSITIELYSFFGLLSPTICFMEHPDLETFSLHKQDEIGMFNQHQSHFV